MLKVLSRSWARRRSLTHHNGELGNLVRGPRGLEHSPATTSLALRLLSFKFKESTTEPEFVGPSLLQNQQALICRAKSSYTNSPSDSSTTGDQEQGASMSQTQYAVDHDKSRNCFYINLCEQSSAQPKVEAILEYSWVQAGVVDLFHTEVPPEFRGHGIAKILAEAALDHFCQEDAKIRPTCTYIQKYLRENPLPRYMDHVDHEFL